MSFQTSKDLVSSRFFIAKICKVYCSGKFDIQQIEEISFNVKQFFYALWQKSWCSYGIRSTATIHI